MVSEDQSCAPIGDACGGSTEKRLALMEQQLAVGLAQIRGFDQRLCQAEASLLASFEIKENGVISLTYGNGNVVDTVSPYLQQLLVAVSEAINDTSAVTGGEIDTAGRLKLFRTGSTEIDLGNLREIVNPARQIAIRNDGRIEVTLYDTVTKFSTSQTIQSAVNTGGGGGGGGEFGMSLLGTPVEFATTTTPGSTADVDIAALSGVTVPVGATHVLVSAEVQFNSVNLGGAERQANYGIAFVEGKEVSFAGRRNVNGSEPTFGNFDINSTNTGYAYIPLPGDNELTWKFDCYRNNVLNGALDNKFAVRANFKVIGFVINGGSQ